VVSRGLLAGKWTDISSVVPRPQLPRFQGDNMKHNLSLVDRLREVARRKGASVGQIAIAWVASRGPDVLPLIGTTRRERLREALGALEVQLTPEDFQEMESVIPPDAVRGTRYRVEQMHTLDSEA
jgi:aryl-alcohol dehydrogenase-like predicted oxidoreductase